MNDSKKEDQPPFKSLQDAKELENLKEWKRSAELELKDTPEEAKNIRERLSKQISVCDIKISAIQRGQTGMFAVGKKRGLPWKEEKGMKSKSIVQAV